MILFLKGWLRRPPKPPLPPPTPSAPTRSGEADEIALATAINRYRASLGLGRLEADVRLVNTARSWAGSMARSGRLDHGEANWRIMKAVPEATATGETIAMGQRDANQTVEDWKGSTGHRAILVGRHDVFGCGVAFDANGTSYWVANFARLD